MFPKETTEFEFELKKITINSLNELKTYRKKATKKEKKILKIYTQEN